MDAEDIDIELEKEIVKKLNCVLKRHWNAIGHSYDLYEFYLSVLDTESKWRVRVNGFCTGRRFWRSVLDVVNDVVNEYASIVEYFAPESLLSKWYEPFKGLESKSLEELAVKVDLLLEEGEKEGEE